MKSKLLLLNMLFFVSIGYSQLFVSSGEEVFISDGSFVSVQEASVVNNGEFIGDTGDGIDLTDGEVILNGTVTQTMSGPGNYENLRIENTVGVLVSHSDSTDPIDINGLLTVNGDFDAGTGNYFRLPCVFPAVLLTDPPGRNAQIAESSGTINGDITVQQCIPGRRAFRLVTSSTTGSTIHNEWQENPGAYTDDLRLGFGTHITGLGEVAGSGHTSNPGDGDQFQGLDWQPSGNPSMFSFDESANPQAWVNVEDTEVALTAGEPYLLMIRGSRDVDLTDDQSVTSDTKLESVGTVLTGNVPITPDPSVNSIGEAVLVGNPYHAVVDLLSLGISTSDYEFAYIYDPNLGGAANTNTTSTLGGRGGYVTVDLSDGTINILGSGGSEVNQYLQPYQAFFLVTTSGTASAFSFNESDKEVEQPQTDVFNSSQPHIFVNLFDQESYVDQNTADDGLVIYFSDDANNSVDSNDAIKFFNSDEMIARNENGSLISYENRAMPVEEDVLNLYTNQYRTTDYILEVGVQFLPEHTAYLYDRYTDTEILLEQNVANLYNFSVDGTNPESIATDRFEIRFDTSTFSTSEFDLEGISVYPNPTSEILNIGFGDNIGRFDTVQLFDITGRLVSSQTLNSQLQETQLDVNTFNSGVYVLKVSSETEQLSTKVIIK